MQLACDFVRDHYVQSMDEAMQRRYIMLACLHRHGELKQLNENAIGDLLQLSTAELQRTKTTLLHKELLDEEYDPVNDRLYWSIKPYHLFFPTKYNYKGAAWQG